jgi:hypothetical protein
MMFLGLLWYTWLIPSSQGRLIFPGIAAIALFWAAGWVAVVPARWSLLPGLLLAPLTLWVPYGVIRPAYSQPTAIPTVPSSAHTLGVKLGNVATLLGYELPNVTVYPGEELPLTLYWQSETPPSVDYSVFIHLVDETDQIVAQRDLFPGLGNYPTSQWVAGKRFADRYVLQIPNTAFAPSNAQFAVGLYNAKTGERLLTAAGDDQIRLGQIQLQARPGQLPNPQNIGFADGIALVGYDLTTRGIAAGEPLDFTLYWQARQPPTQDYKVFVHLISDDAHKAAQQDRRPQEGAAPTLGWTLGTTIVDRYQLQTDMNTPPGIYWLVVGLYRDDTGDLLPLLYNGSTPLQADSIRLISIRITAD